MKKTIASRAGLSFILGIAIGTIITIINSAFLNNGQFYPTAPALVVQMGGELNAVIVQTICSGLLGASFGVTSICWQQENWSLLKQTVVYFSINTLVMLPVAWFLNWMKHSWLGFISYLSIFILIFVIYWTVCYTWTRLSIRRMNKAIGQQKFKTGNK